MIKIVSAEPRSRYRIWLEFADGAQGEVDLSDLAGRGVFEIWNEPGMFEDVTISRGGSLSWPNDVELGWDGLYIRLTGKSVEEVFPGLKETPVDA
jgi:hypothetical protein